MRLEAWDSVFVRARRADVHSVLRDVAGYGAWWTRLRVEPQAAGAVLLLHRPPGAILGRRGHHRVAMRLTRERIDLGLDFACRGDLQGESEWYYLDEVDGVTVHYLLRADPRARARRGGVALLDDHRASVRAGLHALKDRLEAGRAVGAEPEAELLAHQRLAAARSGRRS